MYGGPWTQAQARGYGVELLPAVEVRAIEREDMNHVVRLSTDQEILQDEVRGHPRFTAGVND